MSIATPLGVNEGGGWTRIGRYPGPVMRALSFMRIQRGHTSWHAWDAINVPIGGHPHASASFPLLREAKSYAERVVASVGEVSP